MAIDTRRKRASALNFAVLHPPSVQADGTLDEFDLQHVLLMYAGIDVLEPPAPVVSPRRLLWRAATV